MSKIFSGKKLDVIISGTEGQDHQSTLDNIDGTNVVDGQWTKFEIGIGRHETKFQVFHIKYITF